jgi:hypothetical protein
MGIKPQSIPYTSSDLILLQNDHRYVPVDPSFVTFDSFTFESTLPVQYDGPILDLAGKMVMTMLRYLRSLFFVWHALKHLQFPVDISIPSFHHFQSRN